MINFRKLVPITSFILLFLAYYAAAIDIRFSHSFGEGGYITELETTIWLGGLSLLIMLESIHSRLLTLIDNQEVQSQ